MSSGRPRSAFLLFPLALVLLLLGLAAIGGAAQEATDKPLYLVARPELRNPYLSGIGGLDASFARSRAAVDHRIDCQ
jgi:hypothetical protein